MCLVSWTKSRRYRCGWIVYSIGSEPTPACFTEAGASLFANGWPKDEQTESGKTVGFSAEPEMAVANISRLATNRLHGRNWGCEVLPRLWSWTSTTYAVSRRVLWHLLLKVADFLEMSQHTKRHYVVCSVNITMGFVTARAAVIAPAGLVPLPANGACLWCLCFVDNLESNSLILEHLLQIVLGSPEIPVRELLSNLPCADFLTSLRNKFLPENMGYIEKYASFKKCE